MENNNDLKLSRKHRILSSGNICNNVERQGL